MNFGNSLALKRQQTCLHPSRITIRSHGIERQICEGCDHVSFAFAGDALSQIDRDRFARPVDQFTSDEEPTASA